MGVRPDSLVIHGAVQPGDGASAPIVFSAMRRRDLDAVVAIERRAFVHPWSREVFARELRVPFSKVVLARIRGEIVGYACRWLHADAVEVQNVAVHPDWRRRSIGRQLVETLLAEARAAGVSRALLEVRRTNRPALSLYRKLGFRETGTRPGYYSDGEDAVLMERNLDSDRG
jgi:[ribosomal protein S18]-alanine N-acetyltransferase